MKTNVDGIEQLSKGVLLNTKPDDYEFRRKKLIEEQAQKEKVKNLEGRINNIELLLQQILEKVSNG